MASLPVVLASGDPAFTPSSFMPDVRVEIAFNAGYVTPAAERVWTDVSQYVELKNQIQIDVGRQDERSTADANSLNLTLDNTDGRFTAGRAASPYYPNVRLGRPIRVSVTVDGYTSIRFVGFVDEWPVEWDGTDTYARAQIKASSRMARLGLSTKLRSMIENEILLPRPFRYWTLGDASGSTLAVESVGRGALYVTEGADPVTFGNAIGPGSDGLTAAEFTTTSAQLESRDALELASGPRTLRCWVLVTAPPPGGGIGALLASDSVGMTLYVSSTGLLGSGVAGTGPSIADGSGHDVALVRDGTNEILYLDGVAVASAAAAAPGAASTLRFGLTDSGAAFNGAGTLAHVAAYDKALTPAQVAAQAEVVLSGANGDRTDERLLRILGWAGVPAGEVAADAGSETMTYQQTSGQSVVDAARDVESTEGGVLFDGRDGKVEFHNRSHRYLASPAVTLSMTSQHVGSDYSPKLDRSALTNDVTVDNPTTGETAHAVDMTSSDEYGVASTSAKSLADTYDPLQQKAAWLLASYAEPRTRVPSLTVDVLAHHGLVPSAQTLLGLNVSSLLAVTNAPIQADATGTSYFVEGYSESIGPESYELTFNLSPTYPTLNTFVLEDPIRGQLDSTYVLAL